MVLMFFKTMRGQLCGIVGYAAVCEASLPPHTNAPISVYLPANVSGKAAENGWSA